MHNQADNGNIIKAPFIHPLSLLDSGAHCLGKVGSHLVTLRHFCTPRLTYILYGGNIAFIHKVGSNNLMQSDDQL